MNAITPISSSPNFNSSSELQKLEQQKQNIQASIEQVKKNDRLDEETKQKKLKELQQKLAAIEQSIQQAKQKAEYPAGEAGSKSKQAASESNELTNEITEPASKTILSPKKKNDLKQTDKILSLQREPADEYISSLNQPKPSAGTYHLTRDENGQPIISFDKFEKDSGTRNQLEHTQNEEEKKSKYRS